MIYKVGFYHKKKTIYKLNNFLKFQIHKDKKSERCRKPLRRHPSPFPQAIYFKNLIINTAYKILDMYCKVCKFFFRVLKNNNKMVIIHLLVNETVRSLFVPYSDAKPEFYQLKNDAVNQYITFNDTLNFIYKNKIAQGDVYILRPTKKLKLDTQ